MHASRRMTAVAFTTHAFHTPFAKPFRIRYAQRMEMLLTGIGLLGVVCSLGAYALLTRGTFTQNDPRYYTLNIIGTLFIALSLVVQWNAAALVSQIIWLLISMFGLVRSYRSRA